MKIVFLGTSNFARIVLEKLFASPHEIVAVVCGVTKQTGRGQKLVEPQTKLFAKLHNLPCFQFSSIRKQGVEILKSLNADIFVTASYGQILSQEILDIAPFGVINVHGSLLPKYRGASPVLYAILNGEKKTGVTIMQTSIGIDDGDILDSKEIEIDDEDNTQTLMDKLALVGAKLLIEVLPKIENKTITRKKQNQDEVSVTKMIKKENSFLDFSLSSTYLQNFVRAYNPNPSAHFVYENKVFKVIKTKVINIEKNNYKAGEVVCSSSKEGLIVACGQGLLEILILQAPNGKMMSAKSYLNGKKISQNSILSGKVCKD